MRLRVVATAVIVLGTLLLASVAVADYPDEGVGVGSTETWVMNVHETLDANVVASFIDQDGQQTWSSESTIAPLGNDSFPASSSELESGWLGSMTIDSLRPIASVAETIWQDVPRGDGWSAAAYIDAWEGASEIFFPRLIKTSYYRSQITIQCLDTEECQVSMTYRDEAGNLVTGSPIEDTIEPFSQETYDLWDASLNPHIPEQQYTASPWYGNLRVTSTQLIAGVSRIHVKPGHVFAYEAIPGATGTEIFFPGFVRRNFNGNWSGESDWSAITVQNPNDYSVTIYLNFYDRDGVRVLRFSDDIPAHGSAAYNARYGTGFPFGDLPDKFNGSVVVTSNHPIVGVCEMTRVPGGGMSAAYSGVSSGSQKLVFPLGYRVKEGTAWRQYSGLNIQNLDGDEQVSVHLEWMDSDGDVLLEFNDTIPAYATHGYNTRYSSDQDYDGLGTSWTGTVVVSTESDAGLAGFTGNTAKLTDYLYLTQYNGIPME
jgi:hypothetical protein